MTRLALIAAIVLTATPALAQVDRGPYLQFGTSDSMMVVWRTASSEPSVVCYGSSMSSLTSRATAGAGYQHEVPISGLSADTRYFYALSDDACPPPGGGDATQYFHTAPTPGAARPFRFWVVGDSGTGGTNQRNVRDAMLANVGAARPDIYVHVGDMAYSDGTTAEFDQKFYAIYDEIIRNTVCWPAIGNHEAHTSESSSESGPYYDGYVLPTDGSAGGMASGTEAYYSFDYANVHFVALDSADSNRDVGGAMLTWLELDLASTDQDWIIAYWHHPPYTKGSHDSDGEGSLVDMRENANPILEAGGVDLVLGGHSHIYERSYLLSGAFDTPTTTAGIIDMSDGRPDGDGAYVKAGDGTIYVVAGHGGTGVSGAGDHPVMYFSEVENGSNIVDVTANTLTLTNIRYDGVETDQVVLVKGEGLFMLNPRGGENLLAGSEIDIAWGSTGPVADVRIEYTIDDGATWEIIADGSPNDGVETWTVPLFRTTTARIRVTDSADPTTQAETGNFEISGRAEIVAIPMGGIWEYLDDGSDPGAAWRTEVGGWMSGPAELGYGDADIVTTLYDTDPNIATVFFRTAIDVDQPVVSARLRVHYDDGVMVWVNGTEVAAYNIADGEDYGAYATTDGDTTDMVEITITDGAPFLVGENIISAIVKQHSGGSSDVSFDLELILDIELDLPGLPPPSDGGTLPDGGPLPDGGTLPDGAPLPGGDDVTGGCGCTTPGEPSGAPLGALVFGALGVALLWRRRR